MNNTAEQTLLPLPAELSGKKAEPFIDESHKLLYCNLDGSPKILLKIEILYPIQRLQEFLSQPFREQMVVEYFERVDNVESVLNIIKFIIGNYVFLNLDQFITLCKINGVDGLEWRKK